jgi:hypothetical protein
VAAPRRYRPLSVVRVMNRAAGAGGATGTVGSRTQPASGRRQDGSWPAPRVASPHRPTVPPGRVRVAPHLLDPCQRGLMLDGRRHRRSAFIVCAGDEPVGRGALHRADAHPCPRERSCPSQAWSPRLWRFKDRCERNSSIVIPGRMSEASWRNAQLATGRSDDVLCEAARVVMRCAQLRRVPAPRVPGAGDRANAPGAPPTAGRAPSRPPVARCRHGHPAAHRQQPRLLRDPGDDFCDGAGAHDVSPVG